MRGNNVAPLLQPDAGTLLEIYRRVALIFLADERVIRELKAGRMVAPYYSPRGHEIIPAAISVNLTADDYVLTIYRGLHDMLAKGVPLEALFAEYLGRANGTCKGKGGPMHITHRASGVLVTSGIVGSNMPIANGIAWASKLRGDGRVTVANFGDGAANIGAFHESLNLASLWKLPVLFVCQNNRYAEHTAFAKGTAADSVACRAAAYNMAASQVDGNDPVAMYGVARQAIERARAGEGPTLIEALTFRFNGHLMGDNSSYIPKPEMLAAVAADPVPRFRAQLITAGIANEMQLASIETDIRARLDTAVANAFAGALPDVSELRRDVFANDLHAAGRS
jgi:acetoin:2,6-dichlorophenolindophenol oxidoreductase subunit alpha